MSLAADVMQKGRGRTHELICSMTCSVPMISWTEELILKVPHLLSDRITTIQFTGDRYTTVGIEQQEQKEEVGKYVMCHHVGAPGTTLRKAGAWFECRISIKFTPAPC